MIFHLFNSFFLTIIVLLITYWIDTFDFVKEKYSLGEFIKGVFIFLCTMATCSFLYIVAYMSVVTVIGAN